MAVVEVQVSPKGGPEVKKTIKDTADELKKFTDALKDAGKNNPLQVSIGGAREILKSVNGDLRKTLDVLNKAGVATDDIVLLMKQLSKEAVDARKQTLGIADGIKNAANATDDLAEKTKKAARESDGFAVNLRTARTFAKVFNGDLEKTAQHLRASGASTNSIRAAMAALQVEAKGVKTETQKTGDELGQMEGKIRKGVLAAEAIKKAFEAAGRALADLNELAGVDSAKEGVKKSLELDEKFTAFQNLVSVNTPEEAARLRRNVKNISLATNQSQATVLEAAIGIQETKSAGREYLLENGGAGLLAFLKHAYGDNQKGSEAIESVKAGVVAAKDLGLTASQIPEAQGILAAGEISGSLKAKDIQTKFGGVGSQLASLRKTSGIQALRESQGLGQALGDIPGYAGNIDQVKVLGENLLSKLADQETRNRLREVAKIETFDKSGRLRPAADILQDISDFRLKAPKNEQELYGVFRDIQARSAVLGLATPERVAKLRELERVDSFAGTKQITEGFKRRADSISGQLTAQQVQREAVDYERLPQVGKVLVGVGDVTQRLYEKPIAGLAANAGLQYAQSGTTSALFIGSAITALAIAAGYASSANDPKNPYKYQNAQALAAIDSQRIGNIQSSSAEDQKINDQIRAIQVAAAKKGVNLDLGGDASTVSYRKDDGVQVKVEIKVDQDGKVSSVTSESKDTKAAAKGNRRQQTKTQR